MLMRRIVCIFSNKELPYHIMLFDIYKDMVDAKDQGNLEYALSRAQTLYDTLRAKMKQDVSSPDELYAMFYNELKKGKKPPLIYSRARLASEEARLRATAISMTIREFARQCISAFDKAKMLDLFSKEIFFGEEHL